MIFSRFWNTSKVAVDTRNKVLLITANHTGNNIFCTPAIKFLKKNSPNTLFDVVSLNKLSAEVFHTNPSINKVFISKSSRFINKLANNYSKVICLHKEVLKMLPNLSKHFLVAPDYIDGTHRAEHILQFVAEITNSKVVEEDRAYVIVGDTLYDAILNHFQVKSTDIVVCMHLGCGRTKTHGWNFLNKSGRTHKKLLPIKAYVELANALIMHNSNIRVVITGTKNEKFLGEAFTKSIPRTINLIAKTSIPQLYQLMSQFKLFVSQDCGIMHVASASNVPLLGLFGPTNPHNTGPYPLKNNHKIIKESSMGDIKPIDILTAALTLLNIPKQHSTNDAFQHYQCQLSELGYF